MKRLMITMLIFALCMTACSAMAQGAEEFVPNTRNIPAALEEIPEAYLQPTEQAGTMVRLDYTTWESFTYEEKTHQLNKTAWVYLPYGYSDENTYNVFYFMHGGWSNETTQLGTDERPSYLKHVIDHAIADGKMQPMIIVCPTYNNTSPEDSGDYGLAIQLTDQYHNELLYDLMPAVEGKYSTYAEDTTPEGLEASRDHRGFGGFSMGSVTTWRTFEHCLPYFRYFMPSSGNLTTDARYMDAIVDYYGYDWNDYFIFACSGTSDFVYLIDMLDETPQIFSTVLDRLPQRILENQSLMVDAVAGATVSSNGFIAAVRDAIEQSGGNPAAFDRPAAKSDAHEVYDADVVVVGGGTSGSAAAARAAEQGAKVVLIEKSARLGGAGALSSEPMTFGAQIQLDAGIEFDTGATFEDWMSQNHWSVNGHLVSQFLNISGQVGDWLIDNGFHFTPGTTTDTTIAYRDHSIGTMTQKESFEQLCSDVDTILYETTGKSLIVEDGKVVGVEAVRYDGTRITVNAKAVIVATGGFGGSEELMTKYNGGYFKLLGLEQNVGEGLLMMTAVGAQEYHVGGACAHQTEVPVQVSGFSVEDTAMPYTITNLPVLMRLSKTGQRFMDEDEKVNSPTASSNYVSSNGPEFFTLLTQSQLEILRDQGSKGLGMDKEADPSFYTYPVPSDMPMTNIEAVLEAACEIGMAYKADTLEELAEMTGMDIEILMRNINDYNAACAAGEDPLFYKNPAYLYPYDLEGPFYAVVGCVMSYNSLGGVKVDELMRVADTQDQPIPGLYSAGVDSIGTVLDGVSYPNLFGVALGWGFSSGYMAGESAAAYALE